MKLCAKEKLMAYFESNSKIEERDAVIEHIKLCNSCRIEFEKLNKTWNFLVKLEDVEPPLSLKENVLKGIETKNNLIFSIYNFFIKPMPVYVGIILIFIGFFLGMFIMEKRMESFFAYKETNIITTNEDYGFSLPLNEISYESEKYYSDNNGLNLMENSNQILEGILGQTD